MELDDFSWACSMAVEQSTKNNSNWQTTAFEDHNSLGHQTTWKLNLVKFTFGISVVLLLIAFKLVIQFHCYSIYPNSDFEWHIGRYDSTGNGVVRPPACFTRLVMIWLLVYPRLRLFSSKSLHFLLYWAALSNHFPHKKRQSRLEERPEALV